MKYLATSEEMQKIDALTINEIGIPGLVLMERAALAVTEELVKGFGAGNILVVVEGGNNGGDGLAVARMLISKGYQVDIYHIEALSKESDSFTIQKTILQNMGINFLNEISDKKYDVVIDAIFGVGLSRPVTGIHQQVIEQINRMECFKLAVDVPSGLNATTGQIEGICVRASQTVTFGLYKYGMMLYPGHDYCGEIIVRDIGLPQQVIEQVAPVHFMYDESDVERLPKRKNDSNKGTYGRVAVIAGSRQMSGAATLAAESAYRIGSGLVKVYTHENNRKIIGCNLPEALMMTYSDVESAIRCVEDVVSWGDAVLAGPGIGTDDIAKQMIYHLLHTCEKPIILDADGLNIVSENMELLQSCKAPVIITPHMKEMSRLTGEGVDDIKVSADEVCMCVARTYGVVCVLKDARTRVSDGSDQLFLNTAGNNGMSTAGSGDVLAGIIAGLCGQKMNEAEAAKLGVYLHGLAGDFAATERGQQGMIARDIADAIKHFGGR